MPSLRNLVLCNYELTLPNGNVQPAWTRMDELNEIFRNECVRLLVPQAKVVEGGRVQPDLEPIMLRMLDDAQAAFCHSIPGFLDVPSVYQKFLQRIEDGMRVWVDVPSRANLDSAIRSGLSRAERYVSFMEHCGIELTHVGLFDEKTSFDHERTFALDREIYRAGFRDPQLFRGVDRIVFHQAHAMKLHAEAQAAAAANPALYAMVDMTTDLFTPWNEPDLSLISISYLGDKGGCVVASSGLVVGDPFIGIMGHAFPGANQNAGLLRNLVRFLFPSSQHASTNDDIEVHRLIQSIERNLLEFVQAVLGKDGGDWTDYISDKAKQKAQNRSEIERCVIQWPAYLDLADHINTITKNLSTFRSILEALKLPTTRKKVEREVLRTGDLVRLRILDAHVTKRAITRHTYSPEDLQILREIHQHTVRFVSTARGLTTVPAP